MHELSLAQEVIELSRREAENNNASSITEIELEVGVLCGVEPDAFESALSLLIRDTVLAEAKINIRRTAAYGTCNLCQNEFSMESRVTTCPGCGCFPGKIRGGEHFRIISLLIEPKIM